MSQRLNYVRICGLLKAVECRDDASLPSFIWLASLREEARRSVRRLQSFGVHGRLVRLENLDDDIAVLDPVELNRLVSPPRGPPDRQVGTGHENAIF